MIGLKELIFALCSKSGVSGSETDAAIKAKELLENAVCDVRIKNGNVIADIGKRCDTKPHILLDAHIDQIGMICTYITDDGFLKVGNIGGLDRRLLLDQKVIIHGKKDITGIVSAMPPHLLSAEDEKKVYEIDEIFIDTGYSKEEVKKIVKLGDVITFTGECKELLGERITSVALDDRCGAASIIRMAEMIKGEDLPCSISILLSIQEELGERGAKIGAYEINPDIALAVDVSFALTSDDAEYKCGKMGDGPMIGISPSLSRDISDKLISIAQADGIPYQIEVMNGLTSTNADQFSVTRCGVKACTVSIPLKYMHTPVEVIEISDVENTAKLLAGFVRRCGKDA